MEDQNEQNEHEPESDDQQQFSADVGAFVTKLIKRQDEHERKTNQKIAALDQVVKGVMQDSLRTLRETIDTLKATVEARLPPKPEPDPGPTSIN